MSLEYFIAQNDDVVGLARVVSDLIAAGWHPLGGVAVDGRQVYQALTRVPEFHRRQSLTKR